MHFIQVPRGQRKSGSNSNISQRAALRIFETGWGAAATAAAFSSKKFQFSHGTSRFQEGDAGGLKSSKVFQRLELKHLKVERVSTLHNRRHESDRSFIEQQEQLWYDQESLWNTVTVTVFGLYQKCPIFMPIKSKSLTDDFLMRKYYNRTPITQIKDIILFFNK